MAVHIRAEGKSFQLPNLEVPEGLTDTEVRSMLQPHAQEFGLSANTLDGLVIDRRPDGDIILRPEAVYG